MARKKIVLVIVEGPSDDTALGIGLFQVFDKDKVYIHIMHGDITTRNGVTASNIVSKIGDEVRKYARSQHYKSSDFKQIIHIVDMDGAYIPDEKIYKGSGLSKVTYESDGIYTENVDGLKERNDLKRKNLSKLRSQGTIWKVPYRVYYMSCNLDHVLYDKQNNSDDDKKRDALYFAKRYKNRLEEFLIFISQSGFSVNGTLKESWEFIRKDLHSLERHTNLGLCFDQIETK